VSTQPQPVSEDRPSDAVAGLLASVALFASLIGLAYRPARLIPFALVLALVASAMGGRHARLSAFALVVGGVCFVVGMALAVITNNPIF
jgi:hypothetical protein